MSGFEVIGHGIDEKMSSFVGRDRCYYNITVQQEGLCSTLGGKVYRDSDGNWQVMMLDLYCSVMSFDEQDAIEKAILDYCEGIKL